MVKARTPIILTQQGIVLVNDSWENNPAKSVLASYVEGPPFLLLLLPEPLLVAVVVVAENSSSAESWSTAETMQ